MSDPIRNFKLQVIADQQPNTAEINGDATGGSSERVPLTDIIAVHGVNGHHEDTWTHSSGNLWLKDLKIRIPQSRVLAFAYESDISIAGWELVSPVGIWRTAVQLLFAILTDRAGDGKSVCRPIIFIAQGFGGIIIKQALLIANYQHTYLPIATGTLGVVFFGTPHIADTQESWERIVLNMALIRKNEMRPENLACISRRASPLDVSGWSEVSERFRSIAGGYKIISIFEKNKVPWLGSLVVKEESAAWGSSKDQQWARNENHFSLSTFAVSSQDYFIRVSDELKNMVETRKEFDPDLIKCRQQLASVHREPYPSNNRQYPGTFDWIWDDGDYKYWWDNKGQSILHLRGSAGKGKTTLCTLLSSALQDKGVIVLSFFCDSSEDDRRHSAKYILLSMVQQLLYYEPSLYNNIRRYYNSLEGSSMWAKEDMWGLLRAMLSHPRRLPLVCIIDALDECAKDSNGWLLDHLAGLQRETDFPFTLVISSQCSEDDIAGHVLSERFEFVVIDMDSKEEIRSDADKVVPSLMSDIIRETPALAGLEDYLSDELQLLMNQPAATLLTAKTWLGRLAHPQIGWTLASLSISEQIRLSDNGVDCLYETVLRQVSADNQLWAGKALSWISHSYRPLKIDEICIAISIDRKANDMFTAFEDRIGPLDMIHDLTSVLGPLVRIDRDEIHLVHRSLKKFLIDEKTKTKDEWYSFEYTAAHAEISDTCLAYLSYLLKKDILQILRDRDPSQMFEENIELHTLIPFDSRRLGLLLYASEYWPKHYQQSAKVTCSPSAFTQVLEFLRGNEASTWYHINRLLEGCISDKDTFSPLVVAAKLGLPNVIGEFLKEAEPDGCDYETALNLAAINGQEEVVEELLKTAKFSKELELQFSTALMESSRMGHISVVKRLLFAADQRSISNENLGLGVALSVSAGNGHTDIVNLLLDKGVPVNYIHNNLTPLQHAAKNGREQVVLVLLKSPGISISGGTIIQKSPMHLAAQNGYLAIVGLLLEAGYSPAIAEGSDGSVADNDDEESEDNEGSEDSQENEDNEDIEDIEDKEYSEGNEDDNSEVSDDSNDSNNSNGGRNITSPLHLAAGYGHLKVVNRILDVNTKLATIKDGLGMNALHWAARSGHLHVVKRLMELGVSVDETDNEGMQPLHYAAEGGHTQVVRALLDREADPTELGGYFSLTAPIHMASRGGHVDVITALVERGASIDQKSSNGYAAIHAAYAHPTAVRRLIDLGANVNALSVLGSSPLMWAAQAGSVEVVKLLLAAGAIVQTPNKNNSTALHRAAQSDSWGTVETLLSSGASPFARRPPSGVTPIDIAVMTGHEGIARNMVNWIVDNAYWRDPFRMVVDTCTEETIELWLNHRPQDKNTTSSLGTPALLRFAARGISQHVNSLLASEIGKRVCDAKGRVAIDVALHPEVRRLLDPHAYGKNTTKDTTGAAKNSPEGFQGEGSVGNGPSEEGCTMLNGDRPQYNNASYTIRCGVCNENPIEGFFYHCCECTDDNFNVCLKCHNAGKTCLVTDEHKLRVRYIYDRMISFEELSPWVSRLVLPSEVREMA